MERHELLQELCSCEDEALEEIEDQLELLKKKRDEYNSLPDNTAPSVFGEKLANYMRELNFFEGIIGCADDIECEVVPLPPLRQPHDLDIWA